MLQKQLEEADYQDTIEIVSEDADDETPLDIPPDRRRVKTDKKDLPVETLNSWVSRGRINLQPEFQRYFVWNNSKASRLIESLLLYSLRSPIVILMN